MRIIGLPIQLARVNWVSSVVATVFALPGEVLAFTAVGAGKFRNLHSTMGRDNRVHDAPSP